MEALNGVEGRTDPPVRIEWGVAALPLPGQIQSGDRAMVDAFGQGVLVAAVDGLGHGEEAAAAAEEAVATLGRYARESVITMVQCCHERLLHTRGAVMGLASFWWDGTMTWTGVGNIEAVLLRADGTIVPSSERLLVLGGVVGYQLPALRASVLPVSSGDTLILATDGIEAGFVEGLTTRDPIVRVLESGTPNPGSEPRRLAHRILERGSKGTDDALVLVARYLGPSP